MPPLDMVHHLVGMQAQVPGDPYIGLWSRIGGFDPQAVSSAMADRRLARLGVMRTTLHLVTANDALALRAFTQPVLERTWKSSPFARHLDGLQVADVLAEGRAFLAASPATTAALGRHLAEHFPGHQANALAYSLRFLEPILQVPPRGMWRRSHQATWTTVEAWLGRPMPSTTDDSEIVLRYLAAFGPASVRDVQAWCWRTKLGVVLEELRPRLVTFRDANGVELFDLPDAPRPHPDTPAPVRFLPEYDNLLLSHRDRSRFAGRELTYDRFWHGSLLVDGVLAGTWRTRSSDRRRSDPRRSDRGSFTLEVGLFEELLTADADEVEAEAARLAAFLAPESSTPEVRLARA